MKNLKEIDNNFDIIKNKNEIINLIPENLGEYKNIIYNSFKECLKIELDEIDLENEKYYISKVGGTPYMEKDFSYPLDKTGEPMLFLAQINFGEVPKFENYPEKGILQFFIGVDEYYGLNYENNLKSDIKVIYKEFIDLENQNRSIKMEEIFLKLKTKGDPFINYPIAFKIKYSKSLSIPNLNNIEFNNLGIKEKDLEYYAQFLEKNLIAPIHQIGGIPSFRQIEIRNNSDQKLLLQIDSQENLSNSSQWEIMFGDMGIMNFFINNEELKEKKFDKVIYNWDCY